MVREDMQTFLKFVLSVDLVKRISGTRRKGLEGLEMLKRLYRQNVCLIFS